MQNSGCTIHGDAEPLAGGLYDPDIRLMGNDETDLVCGHAGCSHRLFGTVDHDAHCPPEDLFPFHLDESTEVGIEIVLRRAIGVDVPGEELPRTVDCLEDDGSRSISEENCCVAIAPVRDARQRVRTNEKNFFGAHCNESMGNREAVDEARAGSVDVEGSTAQPESVLNCR